MTDLGAALSELERQGLYRTLRTVERDSGGEAVLDGQDVLVLCSNDYLGLRHHPEVRAAAADAAHEWGAGAGSSRLVAGSLDLHRRLEQQIAEFKGHERCVLFGSGYLANVGIIAALAGPDDVILSDALNHASIVDGCRLSRAETVVYEHGNMEALERGLRATRGRDALIVTDGVFSMDGDLVPIEELVSLADRHGARVLVDESHATGVVGPAGRGIVAMLGLQDRVDIVVGTLSKALGSYGAFACCNEQTAEFLINRARTLIYSTAPPPTAIGAALAGLRIVREQPELVGRVKSNAQLIRRELSAAGLAVSPGEIPIVPLIVGDARDAAAVSAELLSGGLFVQAIRPPTVPEGTSRLRLTVSAAHAETDLRAAAAVIARAIARAVKR